MFSTPNRRDFLTQTLKAGAVAGLAEFAFLKDLPPVSAAEAKTTDCAPFKCSGGACLRDPLLDTTCGGATDCFQAGACNPVSGICFSAPKPNGTGPS